MMNKGLTHEDRVKYLRDSVTLPKVQANTENQITYDITDKGTIIIPPTRQPFPKEAVNAYKILISAQDMFDTACKEYAPDAPLRKEDRIKYKKTNWSKFKYGEVFTVKYQPFSNNKTFGAWRIGIKPLDYKLRPYKKEFVNESYEFLESTDKVILCRKKK